MYCPNINEAELPQWIKKIAAFDGYKLITVANLNTAKAVERIPRYIGAMRRAGICLKWILVGNGVQAEAVQQEIDRNNINPDVVWKKENISHSQLIQLFSVTDFYILFHKYSIFDLSTLEAMHYGNIPILTPVGGNKEVIIDHNGLFVTDFDDASSFIYLLQHESLADLRANNQKIKRKYFDEKAFLARYVDLCNSLDFELCVKL